MLRKKTAKRPSKSQARKPSSAPSRRTARSTAPVVSKPAAALSTAPTEPSLTPAPSLTSKQLRELRGQAHSLEPVVQVGHSGVTPSVVRQVTRALLDHELIKVRLHEPQDKKAMAAELAESTRAALCGLIGHTVILYRPRPKPKGVSGVARSAIKRNQQPKRGRR